MQERRGNEEAGLVKSKEMNDKKRRAKEVRENYEGESI